MEHLRSKLCDATPNPTCLPDSQ